MRRRPLGRCVSAIHTAYGPEGHASRPCSACACRRCGRHVCTSRRSASSRRASGRGCVKGCREGCRVEAGTYHELQVCPVERRLHGQEGVARGAVSDSSWFQATTKCTGRNGQPEHVTFNWAWVAKHSAAATARPRPLPRCGRVADRGASHQGARAACSLPGLRHTPCRPRPPHLEHARLGDAQDMLDLQEHLGGGSGCHGRNGHVGEALLHA